MVANTGTMESNLNGFLEATRMYFMEPVSGNTQIAGGTEKPTRARQIEEGIIAGRAYPINELLGSKYVKLVKIVDSDYHFVYQNGTIKDIYGRNYYESQISILSIWNRTEKIREPSISLTDRLRQET